MAVNVSGGTPPSGLAFTGSDPPSVARFNRKCNLIGSGLEILAFPNPAAGMVANCIADGGGMKAGTTYVFDGQLWQPRSMVRHTHVQDLDEDGGPLSEIIMKNVAHLCWVNKSVVTDVDFLPALSGEASITFDSNVSWGVIFSTGPTTSGMANGHHSPGPAVDLGLARSKFVWAGFMTDNKMVGARVGCGMESLYEQIDSWDKYGMEMCDSIGQPRNWDLVCANSTARTAVTTSENVQVSDNFRGYIMMQLPALYVKLFMSKMDGTQTLLATKTTNVPNGQTVGNQHRTCQFGIITYENTDKQLGLLGFQLVAQFGDPRWETIIE